jgi:hypothetical protein
MDWKALPPSRKINASDSISYFRRSSNRLCPAHHPPGELQAGRADVAVAGQGLGHLEVSGSAQDDGDEVMPE